MKLSEMWSNKPTGVWLHRLNKDGTESGMRDARRYYTSKQQAINHHNHMVDANPGKTIAHNLHVQNELGNFKLKLVGYQTGRAAKTNTRSFTMKQFLQVLEVKGSSASVWLEDDKLEELLKLYNGGASIEVQHHIISDAARAAKWFEAKSELMASRGYKLFAKRQTPDIIDALFVRN